MYCGNCRIDVQKRIREIREIPAPVPKHRWIGALICAFIVVDFITIQGYLMTLFNDIPILAGLVAFVMAAILDGCPSAAAAIFSSAPVGCTDRDRRERKIQVGLLLGAAVAAFLIFCGFAVVYSMLSGSSEVPAGPASRLSDLVDQSAQEVDQVDNSAPAAELIRMLIPLATSVGAFGFSFCPGEMRAAHLEKLKMQRLQLEDLKIDVEGAVGQYEYGLRNYQEDELDYQNALYSLRSLILSAEQARLECRVLLARELGSAEAADQLIAEAGLDPLIGERELQEQLIPPVTEKIPESLGRAISKAKSVPSTQVAC